MLLDPPKAPFLSGNLHVFWAKVPGVIRTQEPLQSCEFCLVLAESWHRVGTCSGSPVALLKSMANPGTSLDPERLG